MAPDAADAGKVKTRIGQLQEQMMTLAREAFDRGQAAFAKGNYRDAAIAFGEAWQHKAMPQFLYNVATSLDKAGDTEQAVRAYQRYLAASPGAADAAKVRTRIEQLNNATGNGLLKPGA
jgi:thioredoxin-like negative regulator of GroEL